MRFWLDIPHMTVMAGLFFAHSFFVVAGHAAVTDRMIIVREGAPMAVIVVPDNAGDTEQFAAEELAKYLERISGANLKIIAEGAQNVDDELGPESSRIFVGHVNEATPLRAMLRRRDIDAFAVRIQRQQIGWFEGTAWQDRPGTWHDLFLVGGGERGTLFAVYDFLEREMGCRWLGPTEAWQEIPSLRTIELPVLARIEAPAMPYRIGGRRAPMWGCQMKCNVTRALNWQFEWMRERYRQYDPPVKARGWRSWHSGPGIALGVGRENPWNVFIYPEWTSLLDSGYRRGRLTANWGTCFSNPEVRDLFAERLSQLLRERPELEFVELGPEDGLSRNYCRCEGCFELLVDGADRGHRGTHTHAWLRLANAVAGGLAESDPDRKLLISAYSVYQEPPDPEVIVPAHNVMVKIATWDGCRLHGYEHEKEDASRLPEMSPHATHREWIETWRDITPAGMMMAEYYARNAMEGMPGVNPRRYIEDVRYLVRQGFVGYWPLGSPIAFQILNQYAAQRAMWNPEVDPDELVRDFCDHAFRAASEDMQRFINVVQDGMVAAGCSHVSATSWMQPEVLAEARLHLDAALAAAAGDEAAERRLLEFALLFGYMELAGPAQNKWLRVYQGERDPELMREAIRLGEKAIAYRREIRRKHRDIPFHAGWRLNRNVREGGSWHRLLKQLEEETR